VVNNYDSETLEMRAEYGMRVRLLNSILCSSIDLICVLSSGKLSKPAEFVASRCNVL